MQIELVSISTDSYPLDGLYYRPAEGTAASAVQLMHANCFNFYTGPMRFLPPALTKLGYACLVYNRRGHDVLATVGRTPTGGAFQTVSEAVADNNAAARWLTERGFAAPTVIGHSNGGMLAVRHVADHPETPALVLLSAHCGGKGLMLAASKAGLFAGERHQEVLAKAQEKVAAGKGHELMLLPGWYYLISAKTFVDQVNNLPDILELAPRIRCPALFFRGDMEPKALYPAEDFAAHAGGRCEVKIVPDCDHFYGGCENTVCEKVATFLQSLPAKAAGQARAATQS